MRGLEQIKYDDLKQENKELKDKISELEKEIYKLKHAECHGKKYRENDIRDMISNDTYSYSPKEKRNYL